MLCEACSRLGWKCPTKIQKEALPVALRGRDVIGLAETGSGKTASFALPILQALLDTPSRLFALVLTPTRLGDDHLDEHVVVLIMCAGN